ncbi:MAG: hypothetical protein CO113_04180 [Elusimicrobia bacterium CG_4_9_14_3_um_filter_62_55]|nr:MAG: hypothetical protein COR54_16610 [Elusimicrobia bacterium CG22_combo_CG10-13_8_21_14_all_63_91]PJA18223.1 MAG: hypothetical protein COX66_01820 [Elusimicrobia bacterium CG_4_10_14_0_2_um_filter_63_34]PJB26305.1 MAG: hypothetical protein CO113_04180 [Elusimicrobia bacterium CG_4_9_14_3_um_filter_62_55]
MKPRREQVEYLVEVTRIEAAFIEECLECGAVELKGSDPGSVEITPSHLAKLRRLQRICRDLDVDILAGSIIVDLLDRVDEMERELKWRRR